MKKFAKVALGALMLAGAATAVASSPADARVVVGFGVGPGYYGGYGPGYYGGYYGGYPSCYRYYDPYYCGGGYYGPAYYGGYYGGPVIGFGFDGGWGRGWHGGGWHGGGGFRGGGGFHGGGGYHR